MHVSYLVIEHLLCLNYIKIKHSFYSLSLCLSLYKYKYIYPRIHSSEEKTKANRQDKMKNLLLLVVFIGILYSGECFLGGIRRK